MPKVAVIILNYKVKQLAIECVESVKKSDFKDFKIFLIDNNSDDGIENESLEGVSFIKNKENLGYSGGNNVGIEAALKQGFEYVFILNPDTYVNKDTIKNLLKGMVRNSADIVSPKIYFNNSDTIWYAGGRFDMQNVIGSHIGVDEEDSGQYNKACETDFATGAAIMIKAQVFSKINLFDEKYFLYYEDADFCYRAKKAGFKVYYIPQAFLYHGNAKSSGLGSSLQDYYISRNRLLFASKFLSLRTRFALIREAIRNYSNPAKRLAFIDFLLGRFGKGSF